MGTELPDGMYSRVDIFDVSVSTASRQRRPEDAIREIVSDAIKPKVLAPTTRFELRYIRGVKGTDVVYGPEFQYLLDAGLPTIAGVGVTYSVQGNGDPSFPDFSKHVLFSVRGWNSREIIFPAWAGRVLVGVEPGTPDDEAVTGLSKHGRNVRRLITDLYFVEVVPFHEPEAIAAMKRDLSFFRYGEQDGVQRLVDFGPGWFEDRIA